MAVEVDWSDIASLCHRDSVLLDRNVDDWRPALDDVFPIEHKDYCWLGKNYAGYPDVREIRARGCDCGATALAVRERARP